MKSSLHGTAANDYRTSHLTKGADYDEALSRDAFDSYMTTIERRLLEQLVARLFPKGLGTYLDFACGTGRITEIIEPLARESWGVDVSPAMLERATRKCSRTQFRVVDLTREDCSIPPADLVTAFRFLANAQDELRRAALRAMRDRLKGGGYLIVNDHRNAWSIRNLLKPEHGPERPDLHYGKLRRMLKDAGFRVRRTYGVGFWYVRYRLNAPEVVRSGVVRMIEPLSRIRPMAFFCPDMVVVAQRM